MPDTLTLSATLKSLTVKPAKEPTDPPVITLTLEPDYSEDLDELVHRIGHWVTLDLRFSQAELPMKVGR